jgi:Leucine-rich repeat (LRR) protein
MHTHMHVYTYIKVFTPTYIIPCTNTHKHACMQTHTHTHTHKPHTIQKQGIEKLTQLETLYLSQNKIREIGSSLDYNYNLVELNLAGNSLWSFKDLLNLTRSSSLRKLAFNDPDYGDNPVCDLCNYQVCMYVCVSICIYVCMYQVCMYVRV